MRVVIVQFNFFVVVTEMRMGGNKAGVAVV